MEASKKIENKIKAYIRKFVWFSLFKGCLYVGAYLIGASLLIPYLEFEFEFSSIGRTVLVAGFIIGLVGLFWQFVAKNLLSFLNLGNSLTYEQAAERIGSHFPEVSDKLKNLLQLKKEALNQENELILASIEQKAQVVEGFNYNEAISFSDLLTYLRFLMIPLVAFLIVLFMAPEVITEPANRVINFSKEFEKKAPFEWRFGQQLETLQYSDYELQVELSGFVFPEDLSIIVEGVTYKLKRRTRGVFYHKFRNLSRSMNFRIKGMDYVSRSYQLKVIPKPIVEKFAVEFDFPKYLNRPKERVENLGNFSVPQGTKVKWEIFTKNVQHVEVYFTDTLLKAYKTGDNRFVLEKVLQETGVYTIQEGNKDYTNLYPAEYQIEVLKDAFPKIEVSEFGDSSQLQRSYFTGSVSDDYGLSGLQVIYEYSDGSKKRESILLQKGLSADFYYVFDAAKQGIAFGDKVSYYFEVRDNDALNGYKKSRTTSFTFRYKTEQEVFEDYSQLSASLKSNMQRSMEDARMLQNKIRKLKEKLLSKTEMTWNDQKELEQIKKQQEKLKRQLEQLLNEKQSIENKQELLDKEDPIREQKDQLQEMLEDLVNEEMDEMMDRIEELMQKLKKEELLEEMDRLSNNNENISEELEKIEELYKKLEFEFQMQESIEKMKDLAKRQKQAAQDQKTETSDEENAKDIQNELNDAMEDFSERMKQLRQLNETRERPVNFKENKQEQESIKQSQQKASEHLNNGQNRKAKEQQKDAAEKMEQLANQMQQQMQQMQQEDMAIDYELLRQLLDNVLTLSFGQEDLLQMGERMNRRNTNYSKVLKEQYKLRDNLKMVKDSLYSISKRVFHVKSFINKEVKTLDTKLGYALDALEQLKFNRALTNQQYAVTSLNNIALMLNESLSNMQKEMSSQSQSSGSKSCNKPKPGMSSEKIEQLRKMNEQLTKKMQGMQKSGEGKGKTPMSESLAKLAREQAKMRELLQQLNEEENKDGNKSLGNLEEILKNMEQNEEDIVNKKLSNELINRQKEIETRLLKAESAVKEREQNNERQAQQAVSKKVDEPEEFIEYRKKKIRQVEMLRAIPPKFQSFYKKLVEDYFRALSN